MNIRDSGCTVTPEVFTDASGQEIMSYEMGEVRSGSTRMQEIDSFNEDLGDDFYMDESGELQHRFAGLDPDRVIAITEQPEPEAPDFEEILDDVDLTDQDMKSLMAITGGEAEYRQMMDYVADNAPESFIQEFDRRMSSSDYESMEKDITILHNHYKQMIATDSPQMDYQEVEEKQSPVEAAIDQDLEASNNFVIQQFGGPEAYAQAQSYAREVLPAEVISAYNAKMNSTVSGVERVRLAKGMFDTLRGIKSGQPPQR